MIKFVGKTVLGVILVCFLATLSGTLLYFIWPVAISAFPGLVAAGSLAAKLTWFQAVCLTWLCLMLIKGSGSISK